MNKPHPLESARRRWEVRDVLIWVAIVALSVWTVVQVTVDRRQDAAVQAALSEALDTEQEATQSRGDVPVAPEASDIQADPEIVTVVGQQGRPGERGPDGTDGADGVDGPPPSSSQIQGAVVQVLRENPAITRDALVTLVAAYLTQNPPPAGVAGTAGPAGAPGGGGPSGRDGTDGRDGQDGANGTDGADAPAVTVEQLRDQVDAYFVDNPIPAPVQGPQGVAGVPGSPGPTCPDGYVGQEVIVLTTTGPQAIFGCVVPPPEQEVPQ